MAPYQQRVITERDDLADKSGKLRAFIFVPNRTYALVPVGEQQRLHRQLGYMESYLSVLNERIGAFPK